MAGRPRNGARLKDTITWLIKQGKRVSDKDIGHMAKARLTSALIETDDQRVMIQAVRLGLEVSGEVGAGREPTHNHLHVEVPPAAQEMIAKRVMQLLAKEGQSHANSRGEIPLEAVSIGQKS